MLQIDLPDLEDAPLEFVSTAAVRGDGDGRPPAFLDGRITSTALQAVALTPTMVEADPDLRAFVEGEAGSFAYHLVRLQVTFAREPERPVLEKAAVELTLAVVGAKAEVWSMEPIQLDDTASVTTTVEFAPKLKLPGAEVELGKISRGVTRPSGSRYLEADPTAPAWYFSRLPKSPLRGTYPLKLVVRVPWQAQWEVTGRITGSTRHMSFLRPEVAELPWPLRLRAEF